MSKLNKAISAFTKAISNLEVASNSLLHDKVKGEELKKNGFKADKDRADKIIENIRVIIEE